MAIRQFTSIRIWSICASVLTVAAIGLLSASCNKGASHSNKETNVQNVTAGKSSLTVSQGKRATSVGEFGQSQPITEVLTVGALRPGSGETEVLFLENEQVLSVTNTAIITMLQTALAAGTPLQITYDPWAARVLAATAATADDIALHSNGRGKAAEGGIVWHTAGLTDEAIDHSPEISAINTTTGNLTAVIPDMATAQEMFNYISSQCCRLAGPYAIDYCITFQYCPDGCYARAHKMCWILNNKYNYATQKVFSFANAGTDELCVKAERWGGCCINWWYHVAPLVTINTPSGPKAYVFDPAMFIQPVPLSQWLHAQENPACAGSYNPHVSMINVQPTTSYSPTSYSGLTFDTDPTYSQTDTTLVNYRNLVSCP